MCVLSCGGRKIPNAANDGCVCPAGMTAGFGGVCVLSCGGGRVASTDNSECVCPPGEKEDDNGACVTDFSCAEIPGAVIVAGECVCTGGQRMFDLHDNSRVCSASLPPADSAYNLEDCTSRGWTVDYFADAIRNIAERCLIRSVISTPESSPTSRSEQTPAQLNGGDRLDSCAIRAHAGFGNFGNIPSCEELFGASGNFPFKPGRFNEAIDRLTVSLSSAGYSQVRFEGRNITAPDAGPPASPSDNSSSASGSNDEPPLIGLAAVGIFGLMVLLYHGDDMTFGLTPHAEFVRDGGGGHYAYGSRLDFVRDDWTVYWTASRSHTDEWRYGTAATWTGDVFAADFSNTTEGMDADTKLSLSARQEWGVWTLASAYSANWEIRDGADTWTNRMRVGADVVYDRWTISPAATWQSGESFGEDVMFRMEMTREF